jgi:hypothetical protein
LASNVFGHYRAVMTLRHMIVEGPDGSGKSGLVARINALGYTTHARASDSKSGPVPDLTTWTLNDLDDLGGLYGGARGPWVYDRHPLISERIYAPIARGTSPQGKFADLTWAHTQRKRMARHALLIVCLPPRSHVQGNVRRNASDQMPGVVDNIDAIYNAYRHSEALWPGRTLWWDYTYMDWAQFQHTIRDAMTVQVMS